MFKELNFTFISLIPKTQEASSVNHYRPISLCNVVYKVITKILSNRLKLLLDHLISPFQAAFIPNRHISENVILTHEVLHAFSKRRGKVGALAIKVDMAKAYDKLEWSFIRAVLSNFGFHQHFITLIMECFISNILHSLKWLSREQDPSF